MTHTHTYMDSYAAEREREGKRDGRVPSFVHVFVIGFVRTLVASQPARFFPHVSLSDMSVVWSSIHSSNPFHSVSVHLIQMPTGIAWMPKAALTADLHRITLGRGGREGGREGGEGWGCIHIRSYCPSVCVDASVCMWLPACLSAYMSVLFFPLTCKRHTHYDVHASLRPACVSPTLSPSRDIVCLPVLSRQPLSPESPPVVCCPPSPRQPLCPAIDTPTPPPTHWPSTARADQRPGGPGEGSTADRRGKE